MATWFADTIVATGRAPLAFFLIGFIVGFIGIRVSVRLIRAETSWWFSNFSPGGVHVHHMVFGVVLTLISGIGLIAVAQTASTLGLSVIATFFGIGAALVLDEFALIFYLRDVYWSEEGRASVDAVFVAIAMTGLVLVGLTPFSLLGPLGFDPGADWGAAGTVLGYALVPLNFAGTAVVLLRGKIWTGLLGIFLAPLLLVGLLRLARPGSPWARWRYSGNPKKMARALRRERRFRRPLIRAKIYVQEIAAGSPSIPDAKRRAERELDERVHPAPAPPLREGDGAHGWREHPTRSLRIDEAVTEQIVHPERRPR